MVEPAVHQLPESCPKQNQDLISEALAQTYLFFYPVWLTDYSSELFSGIIIFSRKTTRKETISELPTMFFIS